MVARIRWAVLVVVAGALFVFVYGQLTYKAVYGHYEYMVEDAPPPSVAASAWGVFALDTGEPLFGEHTDTVLPIASLTKLMTALVVLEEMELTATATVSWSAVGAEGRAGKLSAGEQINVRELLFPLLLESSNDAAEVLAEHNGRAGMIASMNAYADTFEMADTSFADPSGLSRENVSTVHDVFRLLSAVERMRPHVLDITQLQKYIGTEHTWWNGNLISSRGEYRGGKDGYTDEAEHTFAGVFEVELGEGMRPIAIVVLGTDDVVGDVARILEYVRAQVEYVYVI